MCAKKLKYAAGDDLQLYATPKESLEATQRQKEEQDRLKKQVEEQERLKREHREMQQQIQLQQRIQIQQQQQQILLLQQQQKQQLQQEQKQKELLLQQQHRNRIHSDSAMNYNGSNGSRNNSNNSVLYGSNNNNINNNNNNHSTATPVSVTNNRYASQSNSSVNTNTATIANAAVGSRPPPPPSRYNFVPHLDGQTRRISAPVTGRPSPTKSNSSSSSSSESRDVSIAIQLFHNHDIKRKERLTAEELRNLLQNDDNTQFCVSAVDALINFFGSARFGTINQNEFISLYRKVKLWRKIYVDNDINGSYSINVTEYHNSLQELRYLVPFEVSEKLFNQYSEFNVNGNTNEKELKFDKFVESLVWLMKLTKMFRKYDSNQEGIAAVPYQDFIEMTIYLGRFLPH